MKLKFKVTGVIAICLCFFVATGILLTEQKFNETIKNQFEKKVSAAAYEEESIATTLLRNTMIVEATDEIKRYNSTTSVSEESVNTDFVASNTTSTEKVDGVASNEVEPIIEAGQNQSEGSIYKSTTKEIADGEEEEIELSSFSLTNASLVTYDLVLPKVNEYLNIRSNETTESEVVGKLYKNAYATILERGNEWTKITSGSVTGYVNNEFMYFDEEAMNMARSLGAYQATVTAGKVNVRTAPSVTSEIVMEAKLGDTFTYLEEKSNEEWIAIQYLDKEVAYITSEFVTTDMNLQTAISAAEEAAIKAAQQQKADADKKAAAKAKQANVKKITREEIVMTEEEIDLLATVVAMEAIGESYEGQLAVANVVINRLVSGKWGSTLEDVIYAPNQFSGANSGRVEKFRSKVTKSCRKAAIEAISGVNNIGNYQYFRMKSIGNYSKYSSYYVLGCHVFY